MKKISPSIKFLFYFSCTLVLLMLSGCGGDGSNGDSALGIPSISNLQYSPQTATENRTGQYVYIVGTINYIDQDGDLSILRINVRNDQGAVVNTGTTSLLGISGSVSGSINFSQPIRIEGIMNYTFDIYVTDAQGNTSNTLIGSFRVTA